MTPPPLDSGRIVCAACGRWPLGVYLLDAWGNATCPNHEAEFARCSACTRLICPALTGGGVVYGDGRRVCALCRRTAIDTKEQARPYVNAVAAWLYDRGFRFQDLKLKIDLIGAADFAPSSGAAGQVTGQICQVKRSDGHRAVEGVNVLYGLPAKLMQGVFAHELGHAWLFLEHIDDLPGPLEEGFCEVMAYQYHKYSGGKDSAVYMKLIEENQSPLYGEGFRSLRDSVVRHSFVYVLEYMKLNKTLPS